MLISKVGIVGIVRCEVLVSLALRDAFVFDLNSLKTQILKHHTQNIELLENSLLAILFLSQ